MRKFQEFLLLLVAAVNPLTVGLARAQEAPGPSQDVATGNVFSLAYGQMVLDDGAYVLSAPLHWTGEDWKDAGLVTLGIVGAGLLDRQVQHALKGDHNGGFDSTLTQVEKFGGVYSLGVIGGFYLGGWLGGDLRAKTVAQDAIAASLIASGIITPVLKVVVSRSRPSADKGAYNIRPFSGGTSFPSGHATQAFAVASVIAAHYDALWIKAGAYGVASVVGFARLYHDSHFLSDVVAGAAIGTVVGHTVVRFNDARRGGTTLTITPLLDGDARGVQLAYSF
jgi:membrane-associated phospholipid phosphatase